MSNSIKRKNTAPGQASQMPESAEGVALHLTWNIYESEVMDADEPPALYVSNPRAYLLDLYAEAIKTVRNPGSR